MNCGIASVASAGIKIKPLMRVMAASAPVIPLTIQRSDRAAYKQPIAKARKSDSAYAICRKKLEGKNQHQPNGFKCGSA